MLRKDRELLFYGTLLRIRPAPVASALKRILRVKRRVIATVAGKFYIDPASNFGYRLMNDGEYEKNTRETIEVILKSGHVFLDVGANEGYFSAIASRLVGDSGKVFAIEPQERLSAIIKENFRLNRVENAKIDSCAISDKAGIAKFNLSPDTNAGSSGLFKTVRYKVPTQIVNTITLHELLDRHGIEYVDLMKIDIEGFEYEAILGSQMVFGKHRIKKLILELHPTILRRRGLNPSHITDFLERQSYTIDSRFSNIVYVCGK
jgi:FkbM family methyltransferase